MQPLQLGWTRVGFGGSILATGRGGARARDTRDCFFGAAEVNLFSLGSFDVRSERQSTCGADSKLKHFFFICVPPTLPLPS